MNRYFLIGYYKNEPENVCLYQFEWGGFVNIDKAMNILSLEIENDIAENLPSGIGPFVPTVLLEGQINVVERA